MRYSAIRKSALWLAMVLPMAIHATEGVRTVPTVTTVFVADNANDSRASSLYFYLSNGSWSPSLASCSATRAYIRKEDTHLISAFLTYQAQKKQLTITVDDALPKKDGGCQVTNLRVD